MVQRQNFPNKPIYNSLKSWRLYLESLTVAPALHPVKIDIFWVIFDSPKRFMNVFPQKSLDALFSTKKKEEKDKTKRNTTDC